MDTSALPDLLTLAASSPIAAQVVAGLVLLAAAVGLLTQARGALQSLRQAAALSRVVPLAEAGAREGEAISVWGEPRTEAEFIWRALDHQCYVRDRERGGGRWQSEHVEHVSPGFTLEDEGARLRVRNRPTEVHGSETEVIAGRHATHRQSSKRSLSGGADDGKRTVQETLPIAPRLVVCGLVRRSKDTGELLLDRDPTLGLLFSTRAPARQAARERIKGILLLVVGPALWVVGAVATWRLLG